MLKKRHSTYKVGAAGLLCFMVALHAVGRLKYGLGFNNGVQIGLVIVIALVIFIIVTSLTIGRDAEVVEQPCDYPPGNISPIQAGLIIDGALNERDVTSTFFYMAQRGYLKIDEYDFKKFQFVFKRFPDSEPAVIKYIFKTVFNDARAVDRYKKSVRAYQAGTITEAELRANEYVVPLIDEGDLKGANRRLLVEMPKIKDMAYNSIAKKKNKEIADLTGKLLGFKASIVSTRREEAESLIREDSEYIWKVMPYAYALSISAKLPKKCPEDIPVYLPDWFSPYGVEPGAELDVVLYNAMLRNLSEQLHNEVFEYVFSKYSNIISR